MGMAIELQLTVSVDYFLALFFSVLHNSDHKMSVVNSCTTMQLMLLLSFSSVFASVGEWNGDEGEQLELGTSANKHNQTVELGE